MNIPVNTKPWIQGGVVGAVAVGIIGFSWGAPKAVPGLAITSKT